MNNIKTYWKKVTGSKKNSKSKDLASTPDDWSWRSWKDSIMEAVGGLNNKNIGMLSASIAYFGVLAFFPLMAAIVAIASILVEPTKVQVIALELSQFLPADIYQLVVTQLENAVGNSTNNALIATVGILLSILGVTGATNHTMRALDVMYEIEKRRAFVEQRSVSLLLTLGLIVMMVLVVPFIFAGGGLLGLFEFPPVVIEMFASLRWLLLAGVMMFALAVLYHFGPSRPAGAPWQWVSWGAIIATILWVIVSAVFFAYLQNFANFSNSYSLFAGVIALMVWLNLSSYVVLLGAEVNHRLEKRQRTSK
jgi:membrane protein